MKTSITSLNSVLAFQLEGVYGIVRGLQEGIPLTNKLITSPEVRKLMTEYEEILFEHRLKLKRIFGYLLDGPYGRKSARRAELIVSFNEIAQMDCDQNLRDILFVSSMQSALRYIISTYVAARHLAMCLDLNTVVSLLDEMIDKEESVAQQFYSQWINKLNNACLTVSK